MLSLLLRINGAEQAKHKTVHSVSVCHVPSYCLSTPLRSPKDRKCKLVVVIWIDVNWTDVNQFDLIWIVVNWISACRPHGSNPDWVTDSVPHRQDASSNNKDLPDHVMVALLEREKLLTQAKAHVSSFEAMMGERDIRHLQSMIRQVSTFVT